MIEITVLDAQTERVWHIEEEIPSLMQGSEPPL